MIKKYILWKKPLHSTLSNQTNDNTIDHSMDLDEISSTGTRYSLYSDDASWRDDSADRSRIALTELLDDEK